MPLIHLNILVEGGADQLALKKKFRPEKRASGFEVTDSEPSQRGLNGCDAMG